MGIGPLQTEADLRRFVERVMGGDRFLDGSITGHKLATIAVTSLPSSPFDGQEVNYVADAAAGIVWRLRYRAASASAYKWEVIGGPPLIAEVVTDENRNAATFADLATVGPAITLPLAGDYDVTIDAEAFEATVGGQVAMSYAIGATPASVNDEARVVPGGNGFYGTLHRMRPKTGLTAVTLTAKYAASSNNGQFRRRTISALPVRVG